MDPLQPTSETGAPAPAPVTPAAPKPKTSWGAIIGLLVIVAAIALGALYFLKERMGDSFLMQQSEVEALQEQSTSTDQNSIQGDLEAQSPDDFDRELEDAFIELDASYEQQ